jgi:hypothetical protein
MTEQQLSRLFNLLERIARALERDTSPDAVTARVLARHQGTLDKLAAHDREGYMPPGDFEEWPRSITAAVKEYERTHMGDSDA